MDRLSCLRMRLARRRHSFVERRRTNRMQITLVDRLSCCSYFTPRVSDPSCSAFSGRHRDVVEAVGVFRAVEHLEGDDSFVCVAGSHDALGLVKDSITYASVQDGFSILRFRYVFDDGFVGADFIFHDGGIDWPFEAEQNAADNGSIVVCHTSLPPSGFQVFAVNRSE